MANVHVGGESVEGFIEVIHLDHYAEGDHQSENIRADIYELIVAAEGELNSNAKALDCHDRD
jgi:hypothetical protein